LIGDNGPDGLARKAEGRKAAEKCKLVKKNKQLWRIKMMLTSRQLPFSYMGIFSSNFSSRAHLDDVADSTLNLLGRQFLLCIALRIANSAILAHWY
jgi:hypothetical protein